MPNKTRRNPIVPYAVGACRLCKHPLAPVMGPYSVYLACTCCGTPAPRVRPHATDASPRR